MKIAVIGNTYEDSDRLSWIVDALNEKEGIKARSDHDFINSIIKKGEAGWVEEVFNYLLDLTDKADVVLLVAYHNQPTLAWMMGYCFNSGKPIIVYMEDTDSKYFASIFAIYSVHAVLTGKEDLLQYDWAVMYHKSVPGIEHVKQRIAEKRSRAVNAP